MKMRLIILDILLLVNVVLFAQTEFSLAEAKQYAFENHPSVKNADIDLQQADSRIKEVLANGFPQLNGSVEMQYFPAIIFDPNAPEGSFAEVQFGTEHNLSAGLTLNQLIFDGSFFVGIEAANVYKDLIAKQKEQTAIQTQDKVEKAYLSALILNENQKLLANNLPNIERLHFEIEQLYINGFAEEIEVDRLLLSKSNIEAQIESLKNQEKLAIELLKFQMGYPQQAEIFLTDKIDYFSEIDGALINQGSFARNRIEYQVLNAQSEINQLQIKSIQKKYLPSVYGFGNYSVNAQRNDFSYFKSGEDYPWFETFVLGLQVNVPIFDSGSKKHQINQLELDGRKLETLRDIYDKTFEYQIQSAKIQYGNALNEKETKNDNLKLAQKIYDTTIIKYKEGFGSSFEVNAAEGELLKAQTEYINTLFNLVTTYSDLKTAYGIYK